MRSQVCVVETVLRFIAVFIFTVAVGLAGVVVDVIPSTTSASLGSSLNVNVLISSVMDLAAFQFDLIFTPSIISPGSISEGAFLPTSGPTFFIPGAIDNVGGTIAFTADTLLGSGPGVNGSGVLSVGQ